MEDHLIHIQNMNDISLILTPEMEKDLFNYQIQKAEKVINDTYDKAVKELNTLPLTDDLNDKVREIIKRFDNDVKPYETFCYKLISLYRKNLAVYYRVTTPANKSKIDKLVMYSGVTLVNTTIGTVMLTLSGVLFGEALLISAFLSVGVTLVFGALDFLFTLIFG